jgi:tRNA(fMet)-specific endonuclease VapC
MPGFMLDTNICIYVIKGRPSTLTQRFDDLAGELCISTITLAELLYGAENWRAPNFRTVEQFVSRLDVLPFDPSAAAHYGQIRAALRRAGRPAGIHDMLIGAHARSEGLVLVTNNVSEFARMPGLRIENWTA